MLFAQQPPVPQAPAGDSFHIAVIVGICVGLFLGIICLAVFIRYFRLWIQSKTTGAGIGIFDLLGMTFRKVNPAVIVRSKIMAVQAGISDRDGVTSRGLEAHYLAGGNVPLVIRALIAARKAKLELDFKLAAAIDLAGRNVLEAVQTSVYPKVIDCPSRSTGRETLDGIAQNGIQLKVKARVTVRANLQQLIGGATEETIVARVGEGIVSALGSAKSHSEVLASPDRISEDRAGAGGWTPRPPSRSSPSTSARCRWARTSAPGLQADQAEADMRVARAKAEGRRAMAVAEEQEIHRRHRGEPREGGAGRGRGAQGHRPGLPRRHAGHPRLLQAAERPGRHRHAQRHLQDRHHAHRANEGLRHERAVAAIAGRLIALSHRGRGLGVRSLWCRRRASCWPRCSAAGRRPRPPQPRAARRDARPGRDRRVPAAGLRRRGAGASRGRRPVRRAASRRHRPSRPKSSRRPPTSRSAPRSASRSRSTSTRSEFSRRTAQLGGEVVQADAEIGQRLKQTFSHDVSQLGEEAGRSGRPAGARRNRRRAAR